MSQIRGSYYLDIAEGNVPGSKMKNKFGRNPAVGTSGFQTIWNGGGSYTGFDATSAEIVTLVSSDAGDNATGLGLRTIRIYGLDLNGLEQNEDVTLNGLTPVSSTLEYLRLDTARGLSAGTTGHNIGEVTIRQSITTANIFAVIPATYNSTMICAYTIPAGKNGYILSQRAALANKNAAVAIVRLKARGPGSIFTTRGEAALNSQGTGFLSTYFEIPSKIPPMTDLFIEAEASATVAVTAFLDILLVDIP